MKLFVKKNDQVKILSGKDGGKTGKVLKVFPEKERLIVERINLVKRHTKANPRKQIKAGVLEKEAPIHASNVKIICPECKEPVRIGKKFLEDGSKVRICRKCGGVV
ncbi:MAG: 50S ribosomal protein L24 [Candidatus Fischerbacteria bacterium RBG_13_37_8]|uniref:Large ribosomal subunit protein uL24 n=1 Tax=Candidatus Fischerbacteria bacterium RBG_13_37_8 TaxID=1817863 RepID=A0A1F5VDZ9_9BACT|nr:ribosomal protein L24 [uncultured bacterium]OGF61667.1 MAG: 50S ribosomal protein L24 [Candidatus Fischerbacteria bacterium RBG_13_37_8]